MKPCKAKMGAAEPKRTGPAGVKPPNAGGKKDPGGIKLSGPKKYASGEPETAEEAKMREKRAELSKRVPATKYPRQSEAASDNASEAWNNTMKKMKIT